MRKLIDPNSSCGFCGGYDLGTRCESCGAGSYNYDASGGDTIMKNKKDSYYYTAEEWSRSIGYGEVPPERLKPVPEEEDNESFDRTAKEDE